MVKQIINVQAAQVILTYFKVNVLNLVLINIIIIQISAIQ
jgi:hypothetical protein